MLTLVARWTPDQDWAVDLPDEAFWADGSQATYEDVLDHVEDTHEFVVTADGFFECHFYPWVVADVRYDGYDQMWFVVAPDQEPISLDLTDPNAADDQIIAALHELSMVFRAVIHR